jgi:hypothetical protein
MPVERTCPICGKLFYVKPSRLKIGRGKFCSFSCWKSCENHSFNGKQLTDEEVKQLKEKLADFRKRGSAYKEMATIYGVELDTVTRWFTRLGIWVNPREIRFKQIEKSKLVTGQATEFEIGFFVGLLEGEGSIGIRKNTKWLSPFWNITNTDRSLIERCGEIVGETCIMCSRRKHRYFKDVYYKDIYTLHCKSVRGVYAVLRRIYPFLICKRKQAELVLKFCEIRMKRQRGEYLSDEEWELRRQVRILNK